MKILAFMILHTGRPYLRYAVESILPQVDRLLIFYSAKPSQGFEATTTCPDTRWELYVEACKGAPDEGGAQWLHPKITWIDSEWPNEEQHVNAVWRYASGYDWVWRLDADEVVPPGMVAEMIGQASVLWHAAPYGGAPPKSFRVPFVHFWRSFGRCCRDGSHPIRLMRVDDTLGISVDPVLDSKGGNWEVLHFGYAQPTHYIQYKLQVSGHRPEFRSDWLQLIWKTNAQVNVHPVMYEGHWNAEDYDRDALPQLLHKHPYFGMEVIDE